MDISSVFKLYLQGSRIILLYMKINFILWNDILCYLNHQHQPPGSVSMPTVFRRNAVSDVARAVEKKVVQVMAEIKDSYEFVVCF